MESRYKLTPTVVLAILLVLLKTTTGWAQTGTASLSGRVLDSTGAVLPGAVVTVIHVATAARRSTVTSTSGVYRFSGLPPGVYTLEVSLEGFRTYIHENLDLLVDMPARQDVQMELGAITESLNVTAGSSPLNVVDSSIGNTFDERAISDLPVEARNVVELLSLQPGAVFIPNWQTGGADILDPRYGAVSGARIDQQNVTLDGVDVNDPELQAAYTSAVRITQEALQEFRVSTSNYDAGYGRSSGPQVSMVTKSGGNSFRGAGYWFGRRTATSTNEYFLELAQLEAGEESKPPKLDKDIFGGALGGPIVKDRVFFYFNYERLTEDSETPVVRRVPSETARDGVLIYRCEDPGLCPESNVQGLTETHSVPAGWYGLTPAQLANLDPLGIGPNLGAMEYFQQYPLPNEPGEINFMNYRFASPSGGTFNTYVGRLDARLTESGNQNFFLRINAQDDNRRTVAQFPGAPPSSRIRYKNFGLAVGHDWVLSDNLMNTFRYGFTQIDENNAGRVKGNFTSFWFAVSSFDPITFTRIRKTPLHHFVDQVTWYKNEHTIQGGFNFRFARIPSSCDAGAYLSAIVHPVYAVNIGPYMPGNPQCTGVACDDTPAVASSHLFNYAAGWTAMLGVLSFSQMNTNYDREGNLRPIGAPIERRYAMDEYELFIQDRWQVRPTLTLTAGLRYSLYSPPYETNGLQVAPTISMGEWFAEREQMGKAGIPSYESPLVQFDLAGPVNGKKGYYDWDTNNFAPSVAVAWTPGDGDWVVRGGYHKVFDRIGMGLSKTFDQGYAYGLGMTTNNPMFPPVETVPGARFVDISTMPTTMPAPPPGGFPATPPIRGNVVTASIDDTLKAPYAHVVNVAVAKQLGTTFMMEGAYVGRFGRDQLIRHDLAMPLNLTDPDSGVDYFTAAQEMINAAHAAGLDGSSHPSEFAVLGNIPYWENLFPDAAIDGLTATQMMAYQFLSGEPTYLRALFLADKFCLPACSRFGPFSYFAEQYNSLASIGTIGRSNYHALQVTARKRMSHGLQFDVNYTLAKAEDMGSQAERGGIFGDSYLNGGWSGYIVNSWDPESNYGTADYDVRHQVNANWIYELPFSADGGLDAVIGGWSVAGLVRWTSGWPFNVDNGLGSFATHPALQGNAMPVTPGVYPPTGTTLDAVDGRPSPYLDPENARSYFRHALPGEVGERNVLRGDGFFTLDLNISKRWDVGFGRLRFDWSIFNLTNHASFDVRNLIMYPDEVGFGRYNNTFATCDGKAGRCMQFGLRYEF